MLEHVDDGSSCLLATNRVKINLILTENLMESKNYQFEQLSLENLKTVSEANDTSELPDCPFAAIARYLAVPLIINNPVIQKFKFNKFRE